jgi:Family of unknown function (DUF6152)
MVGKNHRRGHENPRRASVWVAACCLASLAAAVPAGAHHSFPVHFIADKIISVSGVVTEFNFRNPHGIVTFKVEGKDGAVEEWKAETNSPNILRRRGWTETSIKPGDHITVEGYPSRDGSNSLRLYRVIYPDGHELVGQRPDPGAAAGKD